MTGFKCHDCFNSSQCELFEKKIKTRIAVIECLLYLTIKILGNFVFVS